MLDMVFLDYFEIRKHFGVEPKGSNDIMSALGLILLQALLLSCYPVLGSG